MRLPRWECNIFDHSSYTHVINSSTYATVLAQFRTKIIVKKEPSQTQKGLDLLKQQVVWTVRVKHADKDYIIKANAIIGKCWRKFDGKGNFDPAKEWDCG